MDPKIAKLYRTELEHLRSFMEGEVPRSNRKTNAWGDKQKNLEIQRNPFCITCNEKLTLQNITREHIHPLCLGGFENPKNVIPMCKKCNHARNSVMVDAIGFVKSKAIMKRWPGNKRSVESFLVWAFSTINGDKSTVNYFPELNEAFVKHRGKQIARKTPKIETRAGNLSGSESRFSKIKNFAKSLASRTKKQSKVQTETITCICGVKLRYDTSKLSGTKSYYRCPNCKEKINHKVPESDTLEIKNPKAEKSVKPVAILGTKKPTNIQSLESKSSFDVFSNINTTRGLKLPREPSEMANSIKWLLSEDLNYKSWNELKKEFVKQSLISQSGKQLRTLIHLTMWIRPDGDFKNDDFIKLKRKLIEIGSNGLIDIIVNECKNSGVIDESNFDNLGLYFDEVRRLLSSLQDRFSNFVISKLSETGKVDLGALSKPHLDEFIESEGFSTLTELKSNMGYSRNSRLKKIIENLCGARVKFTLDPNNEKKIFIELLD